MTTLDFIGASGKNQLLMLEIAQALNSRNREADQRASLLREALLVSLTPPAQAVKSIFSKPVTTMFPITLGINPREVFTYRVGTETMDPLYVDPSIDTVFALVGDETAPTQVTVKMRRLRKDTLERDIKNALPKESDLSPVQFLYLIATELQKVVNRQPSDLLNKDGWKPFFIGDLVVGVGWNDCDWNWYVSLFWRHNDGFKWIAGNALVALN